VREYVDEEIAGIHARDSTMLVAPRPGHRC
jgi:hypothetical protein